MTLNSLLQKAIQCKYPEWIVFVSTRDAAGRPNVMPAGWSMFAATKPLLYAIAINQAAYTHKAIAETEEFVIGIPEESMAEDIRHTGSHSGPEKMAKATLKFAPAMKVKAPLVAGCIASFECKLHSSLPAGDHTIFVGEIVQAHADGEAGERLLNFGSGSFAVAHRR